MVDFFFLLFVFISLLFLFFLQGPRKKRRLKEGRKEGRKEEVKKSAVNPNLILVYIINILIHNYLIGNLFEM